MKTDTRIPHSLRLAVFLLRVSTGAGFLFFGYASLFNRTLGKEIAARSMGNLYAWMDAQAAAPWIHPAAAWTSLILGACLILGLATRFAALAGMLVAVASFAGALRYGSFSLSQAANDQFVLMAGLLVIFFGRAGSYIGLDKFFRFSLFHKK